MTIIIVGGILTLIGLFGLFYCLISNYDTMWRANLCTCSSILGIIFLCIGIVVERTPKQPTALDVYKGKTTLEITYRDSVPVDSVVVLKEEFK